MSRIFKLLLVVMALVIVGVAVYAFAASNTVPDTKAGAGSGVISGYEVSNIVYNLDGTDKTKLASVEFDLDAAATVVQIKLVSSGNTWINCVHGTGFHWTCTPASLVDVSAINQLNVVAGDAIATPTP